MPSLDAGIIHVCKKYFNPVARAAIFIIFFWFGLLKVLGLSPAESLVQSLFETTIHFMSFGTFLIFFGVLEMCIGILFLFKQTTRVVIPLLLMHMTTTALPLFLLPSATWSCFLVPTLTGQYIIKNLVIIAATIGIAGNMHPMKK